MHEEICHRYLRRALIVGIVSLVQHLIAAASYVHIEVCYIRYGRDEPAERKITSLRAEKKEWEMSCTLTGNYLFYSRFHLTEAHVCQLLILLPRIDLLLILPAV